MNDNYLALRLSCSAAALDPTVRAALLDSSGLRSRAASVAADGAYLPLTLAELKGSVDHTAGHVRHADDPDVLRSLWNSDRRVAVRSAIARNPNIDAATALGSARWIAERGEPLPANLAERADIDALIPTLHASYLTGDANSVAEDPARWAAAMTVEQLGAAFSGGDQHPQLGGWSARIAAHVATSSDVTGDELDELFAAAGPKCRHAMLDALISGGRIPDDWMHRLAGEHKLFLDALEQRHSYGSSARRVELDPTLLDAVFDFDPADDDGTGSSFSTVATLVRTDRANDWELTPTLAGRLAAIRDRSCWSNGSLIAPALAGLAQRVAADDAETFIELLGTLASRCGDKLIIESVAPATEHLLTTPELAVTFLQAAETTAVAASWLNGTFAAGTCTDDAVGRFVASLEDGATLTAFAGQPQRWGHNPDAVAAVLSSEKAVTALLGSELCPRPVIDAFVARAAGSTPVEATGQRWVDTICAAAADAEPVNESHRQVIMSRYELDPQLHTAFISTTNRCHAWLTGHYPLNQPHRRQVDDVIAAASGAGNMSTLQSVIESRCIDADLIGRACAAYANGCALVSHDELDKLRAALHHYELPVDDVATVLTKFGELAGEWLAGEFATNTHPELLQQILDTHRNASTFRRLSECSDTATGPVADWVTSIPGVLLDDHVCAVRIVAQILHDRLGDDAAAWQLFCELGDRSELAIDEVLSMVQA